ncbi:MAG: hypothetical protein HOV94_09335 [Saccharothrix sp.]|nr:hypothetical protein [Saccharothrix sp.]
MTSTSVRPFAAVGPRFGHLVGAALDVVLLALVNVPPGWRAVPFLTDDAADVVVWVNVGLVLGVAVNALCLLFPRRRLILLGDVLTTTATLVALTSMSAVWPFRFDEAEIPWTTITRAASVFVIVAVSIALLVQLVKLLHALVAPDVPDVPDAR